MSRSLKVEGRRKARVRRAVKSHAYGKPRLSVFRSSKHIYAQIIDDAKGSDARCGFLAREGACAKA